MNKSFKSGMITGLFSGIITLLVLVCFFVNAPITYSYAATTTKSAKKAYEAMLKELYKEESDYNKRSLYYCYKDIDGDKKNELVVYLCDEGEALKVFRYTKKGIECIGDFGGGTTDYSIVASKDLKTVREIWEDDHWGSIYTYKFDGNTYNNLCGTHSFGYYVEGEYVSEDKYYSYSEKFKNLKDIDLKQFTLYKIATVKNLYNNFDSGFKPVLSWSSIKGASGYGVWRKTQTDKKWVKVGATDKYQITDKKLKAASGSIVQYCVRAYIKSKNGKIKWGPMATIEITVQDIHDYLKASVGDNGYYFADVDKDGIDEIVYSGYEGSGILKYNAETRRTEEIFSAFGRRGSSIVFYPKQAVLMVSEEGFAGYNIEKDGYEYWGDTKYYQYVNGGFVCVLSEGYTMVNEDIEYSYWGNNKLLTKSEYLKLLNKLTD